MAATKTKVDPCPEIPGEVRVWDGFDGFQRTLKAAWPETTTTIVKREPLTMRFQSPDGQVVGYVGRDYSVWDRAWRQYGVIGKVRSSD